MKADRSLFLVALVFSIGFMFVPVTCLSLVSEYWNITETGHVLLSFVPLSNGLPFEDIVIIGSTSTVVESTTNRAGQSEVFTHDLTSGGTWRLEHSILTPDSTGDYTSLHPVEKRDIIWEKELVPGKGNFMSIITSVFNTSTIITRTGGLPVIVSADRFKITYILSNWTNYNDSVQYVTLSMSSNVLTNQDPAISIDYPQGATNPFVYGAGVSGRWQFNMSLDRWTLINGAMEYVGELLPTFTMGDDFDTRNEVKVSLIYPTTGLSLLEYDPTGLFTLFDVSPSGSDPTDRLQKNKGAPLWIIGVVVGVLLITSLIIILILKVPFIRSVVLPHRKRAAEVRVKSETSRATTWVSSRTPEEATDQSSRL